MKTSPRSPLSALRSPPVVLSSLLFAAAAFGQTMPQDNWRYDGLQFSSPVATNQLRSIAIGSGGVYVGEVFSGGSIPNRVLQFTEAGVFIRRFTDTFGYILGLACDSAGNVYVLDRTDSRVKKYDSAGNFVTQWGSAGSGDGQFSFGTNTGPNMIAINSSGDMYVADPGNTRVQVFNTSGAFLRKWGQLGTLPGQFNAGQPYNIAAGDDNQVYTSPGRVFDTQGSYITTFTSINYPQPFHAVSKDGLFLYATDNIRNLQGASGALRSNVPALQIASIRSDSSAFSTRGDIFFANGTKVYVMKREYQDSLNFLSPTPIPQPIVIGSAQRPGTSLVDIDYRVIDTDHATLTTGILAFKPRNSNNTNPEDNLRAVVPMNTFVEGTAGNVGTNQSTGNIKRLTWNMPADWAVTYSNLQIEALARDTRNLLGIHWVTVPASGGFPAFQISQSPINDTQLLGLWFWFLSNPQGVTLTRITNPGGGDPYDDVYLTGNSGVYNGVLLASCTSTNANYTVTQAGRAFAYEKMGVRRIDGNQITRANAGKFGIQVQQSNPFIAATANSVVREATPATSYLKVWGGGSTGTMDWLAYSAPNISAVATSGSHNLVLRADGMLLGVGNNNYGQLGDGTTTTRAGYIQVATGVAQIAAGSSHTLFVKTDGTLWAMGYNQFGQLGDGSTTNRTTPVQIATNVSSVAAGYEHSLFIKTDGSLWAMGRNSYRQLGDGTSTNRLTPVQITTGAAQVSATGDHTLFVKTDGTLWSTGRNDYGQLGNAGGTNPMQVTTGVSQASAGGSHSAFVKTNGTLWTMGYNAQGQLGDNTTTNRTSPSQIATGVSNVQCGSNHTVFKKTDNSLWGCGYNAQLQLGGTSDTSNKLVPVQFDSGVQSIAAGGSLTLGIFIP